MLGPNKWRALTIIAGILLANAIDTPAKTNTVQLSTLQTDPYQKISLQGYRSWNDRVSRNLYPPHQIFSNVDNIRFLEKRQDPNDGSFSNSFGAFRVARNFRRRQDDTASIQYSDINRTEPTVSTTSQPYQQRSYVYIPFIKETSTAALDINRTLGNIKPPSNVELTGEGIASYENLQDRTDNAETVNDELNGRRSGFKFPAQSENYQSSFQPQGYREDTVSFAESGNYQVPYSEEFAHTFPPEHEPRYGRQITFEADPSVGSGPGPALPAASHPIEFPGPNANTNPHHTALVKGFHDDVTKFGDINGPITAIPRQNRGLVFNGGSGFRSARQFTPPNVFVEYSDYPGPPKRFYPFKSRTPRVVFPTNDNIPSAPSSSGTYASDSVTFRDQNFGLNDLAAIQDVRNEFSLQDINEDTTSTFKEKGDQVTSDIQCQHQGGTCEFFLICWMSNGLLHGTCGGLLRGCCHRTAKSANLGTSDFTNAIDLTDLPNKDYGPVINDPSCGISLHKQTAQRRIVGGDDAGFGSFPWQAYIRIGSSRCGGSLVSRRHVVTAGHCVARANPRQVHVTLGDYVINSAVEPLPAYTFGVRRIDVHPFFKFTPQADRFDISVLTLERPVHFMPHIAPICLPEKNEDFLGKFGWAAGWGALNPGSRLRPKTLQAVDVPVVENRVCERWHRSNGINVVIYPEMLCAGYRNGGKDSCQGDSGGPLMHEKNGRWYLIGVVSAGYSCATRGQPGIYHRVPYTVDWISYVLNSTS
ncbi:uncharacterized protein LOC119646134 isoform X2 [Hermetia illucens]|nr:uncharacterized protein LOC119646134 isoform X2 [Hermetia illucens]